MLLFLQETTTIVPSSRADWITLLVQNLIPLSTVVFFLWRMAIRPINESLEKINNPVNGSVVLVAKEAKLDTDKLGEKVNRLELDISTCTQANTDQQRTLDSLTSQVGNMREESGETRRTLKELKDALTASNQITHNMLGTVHVDIARLEEKVAMIGDIKEVIREVLGRQSK